MSSGVWLPVEKGARFYSASALFMLLSFRESNLAEAHFPRIAATGNVVNDAKRALARVLSLEAPILFVSELSFIDLLGRV